MRSIKKGVLFALSAVLLGSTGAIADSDVSHNWSTESEAAAMAVFRNKFVELGGVWKETAFPDTEQSINSVKTRFIGGTPPMALQSGLGGSVKDFAEAGLLQNMDEVANADDWASRLSDGMDAIGQQNGHWVAAPVFVDVINWMYTNNEVLAAANVENPQSWDAFKASLPVLQAAGYTPIALGGESWQEAILFDHILLANGGAQLYDDLMSGLDEVAAGDKIRTSLEEFVELKAYTDEGSPGRSWNDTNTLLLSGKGAYFFMGPWAAGGYSDMGPEGERWGCQLTPWNNSLTIVADGFQFIKVTDGADIAAQKLFAQAVMDPATQVAAAKEKGTLPAAAGADPASFEGCPAKAVARMSTGTVVTHWNGRASETNNALKDTLEMLWNGNTDVAGAQQMLVDQL